MLLYLVYEHFWRKHFMLRTILAVGFAVLYLILGIPVLGIEYLIRICGISAAFGWFSGPFV